MRLTSASVLDNPCHIIDEPPMLLGPGDLDDRAGVSSQLSRCSKTSAPTNTLDASAPCSLGWPGEDAHLSRFEGAWRRRLLLHRGPGGWKRCSGRRGQGGQLGSTGRESCVRIRLSSQAGRGGDMQGGGGGRVRMVLLETERGTIGTR
ncbi:hypothetical protein CSOJ01_11730 [Colletotrichum sojae]|uniref:Uncharacterized protein n=1 Tax=Colletotrichum sojae TaxID=2175907 RepID=A0A8H6IWK7_9PEZI|nr:hypothetical protein CSOJ01_11730 [Colletotrichum sojae]